MTCQAWSADEHTYARYLVETFKLRDHVESHKLFMWEDNSLRIGLVICCTEYDYGTIVAIKCREFIVWLSITFSDIQRISQCGGEIVGRHLRFS